MMKNMVQDKEMRSVIGGIMILAFGLLISHGFYAEANGQYLTSASAETVDQSFYAVSDYSDRLPELQRLVSVDAKETPIRQILENIVAKADLGLAYNAGLLSLKRPVTMQLQYVTVGEALQQVLAFTGYEATISKMREIVLRKRLYRFPSLIRLQQELSGRVTDAETGQPLPGVNVVVTGNPSVGTSTDEDGEYRLTAPDDAHSLTFSFVGYQELEIPIEGRSTINAELQPQVQAFEEMVVTAFGVEQEEKALGYSVQEVDEEQLSVGNQPNLVNALSGKISGVNITNTGGAPGRSSRIVIRGINSLDPEANNQPLFVVDGVPIDNSTIESTGTPRGMSNRAADINPNDIESLNVLKGSAATALYGVRAANGAVIITTKGGKAGDTQINFSSTVGFDRITKFPEFQEIYGQGFNFNRIDQGGEGLDSFWPNWGAPIEEVADTVDGWRYHDIWRDATQTGFQLDNSLSISGGSELVTYYGSVSNLQQEGVIPYGDWDRTSARFAGNIHPRDNLQVRTSVNFINSGGNRVLADRFMESMMYWAPTRDVTDFEIEEGPLQGTMRGYYADGAAGNNPLYQAKYMPYEDDVNRVIGNMTIDYSPTQWFNILYILGADYYSDQRTEVTPGPRGIEGENVVSSTGFIEETRINNRDLNSTLNLTFERDINEKFSSRLRIGNDIFERSFNNVVTRGNDFVTPEFYHLSNVRDISLDQIIEKRRLIGIYGDLLLDYDDFVYLNLTGRNDWSSTLPVDNRSFFYPSVNVGFVFSEVATLPDYITFGKLRASYSMVGKDAPIYATDDTYYTPLQYPVDGRVGFSRSDSHGTEDLKPEQTTTVELGADLRFLDNRLRLDFTWYKSNSRDQIFDVPISNATGFAQTITNAGEIENQGIEIQMEARPVETQDFAWDVGVNYSRNRGKVIEVAEGIEQILIGESFGYVGGGATIRLIEGEPFGNIYGQSYQRFYEDGPPEDQVYLDENRPIVIGERGFPVINTNQLVVGNSQPDWLGSIRNSFSYKNVNLSFLIDAKWGQDVYSQYDNFFTAFGITKNTLNREDYHVFEGVTAEGQPNTQEVWLGQGLDPEGRIDPDPKNDEIRDYGAGYHRNIKRSSTEEFVKDASYIKFRNIRLAYSLPLETVNRWGFRNITLSATATNIILYTPFKGFDPESRAGGASSNADGFTALDYPGVSGLSFSVNLSL